ncbi:AurF N-oxygenase family protein [Antrihabitans cavernicola]|uniref:Diiron oxygenase n=1 Tax=Antrihabitans cavernicola TaxID=2495913 RepID=A0A5A7S7M1_9NOCA|nr:diiron oxygenase [Spelaeibacter cavernicola]KAA0017688.1 diiron oxygenase [Spelaeibacter cavernicola]
MTLSNAPARGSDHRSDDFDLSYEETLTLLSEGSVHRHFDPYVDITWDSSEFEVTGSDPRWILPKADPLGNHPWYLALPDEKKIAIGMWRQANIAKVGLQFETVLMGGVLQYVFRAANGSPEFRYCTHEVIEEGNHTLMFQEMVNRIGVDVPGGRKWFRVVAPFLPLAGSAFPIIFFIGILAGEEPIDHIQKTILRSGAEIHPIMSSVMAIHVAEEARHISFAHEFLRRHIPEMSPPGRFAISLAFPIAMRVLCDVIVIPPPEFWSKFDIPESVKKDLFWEKPESRQTLRDYFADVRMLAQEAGLMNPVSRRLWKMLKIDGKASRFRSEPSRVSVRATT